MKTKAKITRGRREIELKQTNFWRRETVNEKVAISGDWLRGNAARVFSTSPRVKYSTWTMQLGVIFFSMPE